MGTLQIFDRLMDIQIWIANIFLTQKRQMSYTISVYYLELNISDNYLHRGVKWVGTFLKIF